MNVPPLMPLPLTPPEPCGRQWAPSSPLQPPTPPWPAQARPPGPPSPGAKAGPPVCLIKRLYPAAPPALLRFTLCWTGSQNPRQRCIHSHLLIRTDGPGRGARGQAGGGGRGGAELHPLTGGPPLSCSAASATLEGSYGGCVTWVWRIKSRPDHRGLTGSLEVRLGCTSLPRSPSP